MERLKSAMPGTLPEEDLKDLVGGMHNARSRQEKFQNFAASVDKLLPSICHVR